MRLYANNKQQDHKIAKDGAADHWSKLRISEDDRNFQSPTKKNVPGNKNTASSPVSTLTVCWSPQATTAPPFKFRRSGEVAMV